MECTEEKVKVSVILPTYNERENIEPLIDEILKNLKCPAQIIVVDDDSPDGTWKVVEEIADRNQSVKLIRRTEERGLTTAIANGISASEGEILVWMDCDFSMPPEKIPELIEALKDCDIAIGSRYAPGGRDARESKLAVSLSRLMNLICSYSLGSSLKDYTSGFIAARRKVFDEIKLKGDYGEYFIDLLYNAHKKGFSIKDIPYICRPRRKGKSKTATNLWGYLRRGIRYVYTVWRLRKMNYI